MKRTILCLLFVPLAHLFSCPLFQPDGMNLCATTGADTVQLLVDDCWVDSTGGRHVEQEIFRELREVIRRADQFIVLDMFLINDFGYDPAEGYYPLSQELTGWIVNKKRTHPHIEIIFISDPVNTLYGAIESPYFKALENAGVKVVLTDLDQLPDSNPIYSIPWRVSFGVLGTGPGCIMPNPMGKGRISIRSFMKLLNMKANHRKTILTEREIMVMSANPHSGSSAHWNIAVHVKGAGMGMLWESERAVLKFSGMEDIPELKFNEKPGSKFQVELITEGQIRDRVVALLNDIEPGGRVDLSMFYLSHGAVVGALIKAHQRGCYLRVILDANKDAFGREKGGVPNRQTAALLRNYGVPLRWANTSGEQFHVKMIYVEPLSGGAHLVAGSANYTRRNLDNFNAESCLVVSGSVDSAIMEKERRTFERWWNNTPQQCYTLHYSAYADENLIKRLTTWFQEITGLSSF